MVQNEKDSSGRRLVFTNHFVWEHKIHMYFFTGLIIGDDLVRAKDPGVMDEMQRKKERIMMQSLRRKQQGEENRLRKLEEERLKKEEEAMKEEERNR